jgi:glycosyltransferase involved in cell wall biosynthesis
MRISVVIPARNAGETLADTLDALVAQTHPAWEAIVIDDGSTDSTAQIARDYAGRDERIQTLSQPASGMGGARNTGLGRARFEWLLFLDSDDWITPPALATFAAAAEADDGIDAVYSRWARVAPGGRIVEEPATVDAVDFFPVAARFCPIPIHACVVRRRLVQELGGFDDRQRLCADWDLWQRLARAGARFIPCRRSWRTTGCGRGTPCPTPAPSCSKASRSLIEATAPILASLGRCRGTRRECRLPSVPALGCAMPAGRQEW